MSPGLRNLPNDTLLIQGTVYVALKESLYRPKSLIEDIEAQATIESSIVTFLCNSKQYNIPRFFLTTRCNSEFKYADSFQTSIKIDDQFDDVLQQTLMFLRTDTCPYLSPSASVEQVSKLVEFSKLWKLDSLTEASLNVLVAKKTY